MAEKQKIVHYSTVTIKYEVVLPDLNLNENGEVPRMKMELSEEKMPQITCEVPRLPIHPCVVCLHRGTNLEELSSCDLCKKLEESKGERKMKVSSPVYLKFPVHPCFGSHPDFSKKIQNITKPKAEKTETSDGEDCKPVIETAFIKKESEIEEPFSCDKNPKNNPTLPPNQVPHTPEENSVETEEAIHQVFSAKRQPKQQAINKCKVCGKTFPQNYKLKIHSRIHSGIKPYKCDVCLRLFTQRCHLYLHMRTHSGEKPYKCSDCPRTFARSDNLKSHLRRTHLKASATHLKGIHSGEKPYKCSDCLKTFARNYHLKRHLLTHSKASPIHLKVPKVPIHSRLVRFQDPSKEIQNITKPKVGETGTSHGNRNISVIETALEKKDPKFKEPFPCDKNPENSLINGIHREIPPNQVPHTPEEKSVETEKYECNGCGKIFNQKGYLISHFPCRSGTKPYKCELCRKRFRQKSKLIIHMRTHSGERPYNCNDCPKTFDRSDSLKLHLRTHSKEKPYECSICKKRFSQRSALNTHVKFHTGEKNHKCSECPKYFARKDCLKIHMRIHSNEKPYQCKVCTWRFTQKTSLVAHYRIHTGEKLYQCHVCLTKFAQKHNLKRHIERVHLQNK